MKCSPDCKRGAPRDPKGTHPAGPRSVGRDRGVLIVEAIVAAFLMLFAFAASSSLFDASLRWESESGNSRRAALVAEKKMEELRALSAVVPSGSSFADVLSGLTGPQAEYPEAPGFAMDVQIIDNAHRPVATSGLTPTDGVHSPCSSLFTAVPTVASNPPDGNPQLNNAYSTYPYTRTLDRGLQMVQVTVTYAGGARTFRLISLVGDPITPFDSTPDVVVTQVSGPSSLNDFTTAAEFRAQVVTGSGSEPEDVTILWGVTLDSTGSLTFLPLDSSGRTVRVKRRSITPLGTNAQVKVQALVRYGGQEAVGSSDPLLLP